MRKNAKFDRDQVVEKAKDLYWEKGFHATSMRSLQDVIDMRPGSIYATFGSKEGLFKEALMRYTELGKAQLAKCVEENRSPIAALAAFIKLIVCKSQTDAPNGMCMLAKTVAELTDENADLLAQAKSCFKSMEQEFAKVIEQAQQQGEVTSDKSAQQLAKHVQVQIAGLRTYARANDGDDSLGLMIDEMFENYPFR
ncbi:TetR/AcrR family transcriptional regulator [Vibrio sp. SCSIO 43136]|uniref:TetR/AcrR family transcriptional regulator n=1 Tax=Vibrio sp. SCSIO 43136 TaxID=2819101 RepID=UPI002075EDAA|nr:TetR/AcrR family transcriptional regulator [Vibrio sp. SCSIO 43136]USD67601.1 TetR/AcrR family transcriptional regulator [Vibrio sp. SCSIO 43136]